MAFFSLSNGAIYAQEKPVPLKPPAAKSDSIITQVNNDAVLKVIDSLNLVQKSLSLQCPDE